MPDSAIAVLPAAGASRRMGRPKLLLPFRSGPLVAAVVSALRAGGVDGIVLVTATGDDELRAWARQAGVATAVNPAPERGMLSSIQDGITALGGADALARRGDVLLVCPADLPHLDPESVAGLLRQMAASNARLAVPVYQGRRGHPLALAPALIPEIFDLDPEIGLKQLRNRHEAELLEVPVDDPGVVWDVDTPADYERLGP
jgi:molybdenum cofactor cytidylyltransferase